jgi:single-strand DNA-binding protein
MSNTYIGRLVRDPEIKTISTSKGDTNLVKGTIAYDKGWGSRKHPVFLDWQLWGRQAETIKANFGKGDGIILMGSIDMDTWEDRNTGAKRSKHFIAAEDFAFPPRGPGDEQPDHGGEPAPPAHVPDDPFDDSPDSDLPF